MGVCCSEDCLLLVFWGYNQHIAGDTESRHLAPPRPGYNSRPTKLKLAKYFSKSWQIFLKYLCPSCVDRKVVETILKDYGFEVESLKKPQVDIS